jgi:hypothetical protein
VLGDLLGRLRHLLAQQIVYQPFPRGLGRMHRHLAWGFGEGDQRRPVTGDPPDVQVAMSPRAREPGVQFLALLTAESAMNQTRKLALTVLRKAC